MSRLSQEWPRILACCASFIPLASATTDMKLFKLNLGLIVGLLSVQAQAAQIPSAPQTHGVIVTTQAMFDRGLQMAAVGRELASKTGLFDSADFARLATDMAAREVDAQAEAQSLKPEPNAERVGSAASVGAWSVPGAAEPGPAAIAVALPPASIETALAPSLLALSDELAGLTERAMSGVVSIQTQTARGGRFNPGGGEGSGVVVDREGHILTNHHVVQGASSVTVALSDGRTIEATVVGSDAATDIALVRLSELPSDLTPIEFGDSDSVRAGQLTMAIGNPFGLSGSASLGMVSATGRDRVGITDFENFIQTDAAINPGNSGGALIDMRGRLIGINTAILSRSGGSQGIGFAIPSNMAREVMAELLESGEVTRGWLGVRIGPLPPKLGESFGLAEGVLVAGVDTGGPAALGGLRAGDVITAIDGVPTSDVDTLRYQVASLDPGHLASIHLSRESGPAEVQVMLGERPAPRQSRAVR
ncbi:MAG: S1-C subfamily serine protease [Bradymonadia bacterium]|jgi:S1-C subfamily serine protease